jgi:transposase
MEYIAFDAHKHYTLASVARPDGRLVREQRLAHERGAFQQFLAHCEPGSPVALETVGNWYWIVDEIEGAGCLPKLVHARKAKLMMGQINKTDKLDARGLNTLQRNGTLPTVWIPPGEVRDQRELPRTRMTLVRQRTQLKNRLHATMAKYALHDVEMGLAPRRSSRAHQFLNRWSEARLGASRSTYSPRPQVSGMASMSRRRSSGSIAQG